MIFRVVALLIYKRKVDKSNSQNNQELENKYKEEVSNLISMIKDKLILYFNENLLELDQNTIQILNMVEAKLFDIRNNENENPEHSIISFSNSINNNNNLRPLPSLTHLKSISSLNQVGLRDPSHDQDEDIIRIINTYKLNPQNNNNNSNNE